MILACCRIITDRLFTFKQSSICIQRKSVPLLQLLRVGHTMQLCQPALQDTAVFPSCYSPFKAMPHSSTRSYDSVSCSCSICIQWLQSEELAPPCCTVQRLFLLITIWFGDNLLDSKAKPNENFDALGKTKWLGHMQHRWSWCSLALTVKSYRCCEPSDAAVHVTSHQATW